VGNQQEMDKSVDYFQQAVARAPDYAMAHAGLAEAYTRQAFLRAVDRTEAVGKARVAVTRALELDPDLAEAHAVLGLVRFYFEWDWADADAELRRALALNPGSSSVHEDYGLFLTAMGRLDEGFTRSGEAARLDPLSVGPAHDLAINAMIRGDHERSTSTPTGPGVTSSSPGPWPSKRSAKKPSRRPRSPREESRAARRHCRGRG
jgi:Tfp pilus assembly protein PilF